MELRKARLQRYWCSNAIVGAALIAAAAMLLPAMLHAQEGSTEVSPPIPGMSWGSPPVQREWEPTARQPIPGMRWGSPPVQREWQPTAQGDAAQGSSQGSTQDAQDHANAQ